MKLIYSFFCFFLLFTQFTISKQESFYTYSVDENIYNINRNNYIEFLSQGLWLVEYYTPWCSHCQQLKPEWKKLALMTKDVIGVAATNMAEEGRFITGIEYYPTIRLYLDGDIIGTFSGTEKTAITIFNWAIQTYQTHIITTKNQKENINYFNMENKGLYAHDEFDNVVRLFGTTFNQQIKEGVWIINYYAPWCGHCKQFKDEWVKLATMTKGNYNVAAFNLQDDSQGINFFIDAYPTIHLYYNGKLLSPFTGVRTADNVLTFIMSEIENHILNSLSTSDVELTEDGETTKADGETNKESKKPEIEEVSKEDVEDEPQTEKKDKNKFNLVEINDENYESFLLENKRNSWLVIFVSNECGLCELEEEVLSQLAVSKNISEQFNAGIVHIEENPLLKTKYGELVTPFYKFFHKGALKKTAYEFSSLQNAEKTLNRYFQEVSKVYDVIELNSDKHFNNIRYKLGITVLVFMPISDEEDIKNCEEINDATERTYYEEFYDIIQYNKEGLSIQYYWVKAHKFPKLQMKFSLYSFPIAVALNYEKKTFSVMKGKEFNADNVHKFIADFSENKQKGKSKSFDNLDFK